MQNKKMPVDYVLAQSAHVLRRVAVIRDYGFSFDIETSVLLDETIKMIDETVLHIVEEVTGDMSLEDGPCSGKGQKNNQ